MNCANHPDRERKAFCQNCGKPLCAECARTVGHAVFCEPCLEARLSATAPISGEGRSASPGGSPGGAPFGAGPTTVSSAAYEPVPGGGGTYRYTGTAEGIPFDVRNSVPPPGSPNPGIAFLLGLIPGVGAMYNGQYAKGVVHLVIFAVLVSLADQNWVFGLFVAAWIFYQAFEAFHTARARRDQTPLPNPFGFNDIGERFGFGRSWASAVPPAATPEAGAPGSVPAPPPSGYEPAGSGPVVPPAYGTQPIGYGASAYAADPAPPAGWSTPASPYDPVPVNSGRAASRPSFPVGALVLIGLGVLFLLGNVSWLGNFPLHILLPCALIGIGVWLFVRRMAATGAGLVDDGSPTYRLRLVRALQGSVWVVLVGILFLLDNLHILSWGHSWPLFIIVGGVLTMLQRSSYGRWGGAPRAGSYAPYPAPPSPSGTPPPPVPPGGSSIVPRDGEV